MVASRFRLLAFLGSILIALAVYMTFLAPVAAPAASAALPANHPTVSGRANRAPVPTTRENFFLPGTQPTTTTGLEMPDPMNCDGCHRDYQAEPDTETMFAWKGSMMANSARDPVFYAALDIANADAAFAGEWCIRCHSPNAWYAGRFAADGSEFVEGPGFDDFDGVQCETCHWMVDPVYEPGNPVIDLSVLAGINPPLTTLGSGALILDTVDRRRGPFDIAADWQAAFGYTAFDPHFDAVSTVQSSFHRESALCGSCHDISNPVLTWDEQSNSYVANPPGVSGDPAASFPIERTYSEWKLSAYNTAQGVYAPEFGGNKAYVSTCQDCHMRDFTGAGGSLYGGTQLVRDDMPLHDLTGANTWVPLTLPLHPEFGADYAQTWELDALAAGIERARYMLENAASLSAVRNGNALSVTVTNETGHKLPTGYPEGRRMWLQVEGYNGAGQLVFTSGAYDAATGSLSSDPQLQVYETQQGLTEAWAGQLGLEPGATFHFALNNMVVKDNRIPPRGFLFDAFAAAGAAPVTGGAPDPGRYADGQHWDIVDYRLPNAVVQGVVRLVFQASAKEYIEFLRDNNPNPGDPTNRGQILHDVWSQTGRSEPVVMVEVTFGPPQIFVPAIVRH